MKTRISHNLFSLEICAGAGGLAIGTARAGFDHVGVIELDSQCCETLRYNSENHHSLGWDIIEADISELNFSKYLGIDLLSGGPPCQPFSLAGSRNGHRDKREMFPHFIRAIRECVPKSFIIENVRGLLDRRFINYFNYVIHQLRFPEVRRRKREKWIEHRARLERLYTAGKRTDLQYRVIWQVLNAANFGVPQRRSRVFIVGVRSDVGIEYSFPLPTHSQESLWCEQWLSHAYWERHCIATKRRPEVSRVVKEKLSRLETDRDTLAWKTVRDTICDLPYVGAGRKSHKIPNHFFNPGARVYDGHDGSSMDLPAKTIKAGHNGVPGGENIIRLDDGSVRYFSVRECARLQAFPDNWYFDGSWCGCMRQIGNAVPVTLGELIAGPLATALRSNSK